MLIDNHAAVFDKYLRYQMIALSYRGKIAEDEHALLLEYAIRRDAVRACEVLTRHVAGGVEHVFHQLNSFPRLCSYRCTTS